MTIELLMPALSPTMEKGTLAKWLVREGDLIRSGDLIAEIETDKATMEFEATEEGRVAALLISEGAEDVVVGTPIALIASEHDASAEVTEPNRTETVPEQHTLADSAPDASPVVIATERSFVEQPIPSSAVESAIDDGIRATPLARRIAGFSGIPLSAVRGSGPKGLIVKADLGLASRVAKSDPGESLSAAIAPSTGLAIPPIEGVPARSEKLSTMRKAIARRLSESKSTVPHFYLTARCNLDSLLALRAELNHALAVQNVKLSVNDMLIKALALALRRVPEANVQFGGDAIHHFERVDVSVAVAIEGGLVTPVIRDVDGKSVSAIAVESQTLAAKAREGNLMPEDYAGGTVSLSNLGMFGIDEIVPVINPPQAVILGVGAGIRQPWEVNGEIALATIMAATASFDHRAIDGAAAARFMAALRDLVENPQLILL